MGDPGAGIQAVLAAFTTYPDSHSIYVGIQPSPASFTEKPVGHINPTRIHYIMSRSASYFSGQYYTQVVL